MHPAQTEPASLRILRAAPVASAASLEPEVISPRKGRLRWTSSPADRRTKRKPALQRAVLRTDSRREPHAAGVISLSAVSGDSIPIHGIARSLNSIGQEPRPRLRLPAAADPPYCRLPPGARGDRGRARQGQGRARQWRGRRLESDSLARAVRPLQVRRTALAHG